MKLQMVDGLPIVSISLKYKGKMLNLDNVLLDTGCSTTIFDTDKVEGVSLMINHNQEGCMGLVEKVNCVMSKLLKS